MQVIGARVAGAGTRIDYAVDMRVKLIRFAKRFQDGNNRISLLNFESIKEGRLITPVPSPRPLAISVPKTVR